MCRSLLDCKGTLLRNALALLPLSGSFVLHLGFSSLGQNCGAEHFECLSSARQAEKEEDGGEGGKRGFVRAVQDHQNASLLAPREMVLQDPPRSSVLLFTHRGKASVGITSFHPHLT